MMSLVHKAMDFAFEKIIFDILREWIITVSEEYKLLTSLKSGLTQGEDGYVFSSLNHLVTIIIDQIRYLQMS